MLREEVHRMILHLKHIAPQMSKMFIKPCSAPIRKLFVVYVCTNTVGIWLRPMRVCTNTFHDHDHVAPWSPAFIVSSFSKLVDKQCILHFKLNMLRQTCRESHSRLCNYNPCLWMRTTSSPRVGRPWQSTDNVGTGKMKPSPFIHTPYSLLCTSRLTELAFVLA